MTSAKEKGRIKVTVEGKTFDKPIEPPLKSEKKLKERIKDIGETVFSSKKMSEADKNNQLYVYYENEKAKNVRLKNKMLDVENKMQQQKEMEDALLFKIRPFWELAYYSKRPQSVLIANEYLVNPEDSEYRENINDFMSVLNAFLKVIHFDPLDKDGFYTLYNEEKTKRENLETSLFSAEKNSEKLTQDLLEAKETINTLKAELLRVKSQQIIINGSGVKPTVTIEKKNNFVEQDFQFDEEEMTMEMPLIEEPKTTRFETSNAHMKEKAEVPELEKIEVEESLFVSVLKEKGYNVIQSENPNHDAMIKHNDENIPICYINYPIESTDVFDKIMDGTDKIYLLFDNNENYTKGNGKFSRWLLFSDRKKSIKFSLSTFDDLQKKGGLNAL